MFIVEVERHALQVYRLQGPGGATVARLTPVQKVACSNHVRVKSVIFPKMSKMIKLHTEFTDKLFTRRFLQQNQLFIIST